VPDGTGVVPAVTNAWLRETFRVSKVVTKPGSTPTWRPTPAEQLQRSVQRIRLKSDELVQQVDALSTIHGEGGIPLVNEVGIPMQDVMAITEALNLAVPQLYRYGGIHQGRQSVHNTAAAADGADEDASAADGGEAGAS
jgi:hypothetical protein